MSRPESKTAANRNRTDYTFMIRLLAVGYVFYMLFDMIKGYIAGGEEAPTVLALVLGIVVLGGGGIAILIISWKQYKKQKAEMAQQAQEAAALEEAGQEEYGEDALCEDEEEEPAAEENGDTL